MELGRSWEHLRISFHQKEQREGGKDLFVEHGSGFGTGVGRGNGTMVPLFGEDPLGRSGSHVRRFLPHQVPQLLYPFKTTFW